MKSNIVNAAKHIHAFHPKTSSLMRRISISSSKYFVNPRRSFSMICDLEISSPNKRVTVVRNAYFARYFTRNFTFFVENSPLNLLHSSGTIRTQPDSVMFANDVTDKIHIIVPLSGRKEQLSKFLLNYEKFLKRKTNTSLIIVYVVPVGEKMQANNHEGDLVDVLSCFQDIQKRYSEAELKFVTLHGHSSFSRGVALQEGVRQVSEGGILLFCDVDILIDLDILYRVRRNTVNTSTVYFPIFFARHNPNVVGKSVKVDHFIEEAIGFWREFSFGMVSIYKHDFQLTEGFHLNIDGWGLEDLELVSCRSLATQLHASDQ